MSNNMLLSFGTTEIVTVSVCGAILIGIIIYLSFVPMKNWFTALFSGTFIPTFRLLSIKNRKLDVSMVVNAYILSKKSKLNLKLRDIESFVQSGGNIDEVLKSLKIAKDGGVKLSFSLACAIELANKNVVETVLNAINSKVVVIDNIRGFCSDGHEVIVCVKASVKVNLERYINGLGEEDFKNSIHTWILENITHTKSYKEIMTDPNKKLLSSFDCRIVEKKSMFYIKNISVVGVDLGRDLNVEKEIQQAEKEKVYAQIECEKRKNAEEIKELQMRSKTESMKSAMLEAEAEVPKALSQAIKEGRFSVMDYYKLMNLQADTALRRSIMTNEKKDSPFGDEGDLFE